METNISPFITAILEKVALASSNKVCTLLLFWFIDFTVVFVHHIKLLSEKQYYDILFQEDDLLKINKLLYKIIEIKDKRKCTESNNRGKDKI